MCERKSKGECERLKEKTEQEMNVGNVLDVVLPNVAKRSQL